MAQQKERNKAGQYVCPDCDRTFGSPQNLGRHRQAMHPISNNDQQPQPQEAPNEELNEELADNPMLVVLKDRLSFVSDELTEIKEQQAQLEREFDWLTRIYTMIEAGPPSGEASPPA